MPYELTEQKMPGFHPKDSLQPIDPRDAADLFVGGPPDQMLWRTAAYYFGFIESGERVFDGVTVVLPPSLVWDVSDEQIHELLVCGFEAVWEEVPREAAARIALNDAVIHRCRRLASGDVLSVLKEAGNNRLLLVADASKYRDDVVDPERVIGRTGTLLAEDVWVPHVVRLATESLALTKDRGCALVFHSVDQVVRAESRKALDDVDGLYPMHVTRSDQATSTELVARDLPRWLAMAASGRSTEVLAEIAGAGLSPSDERQARLNIAVRLRDRERVTRLVREYLADGDELEAEFAARLGRMAHQFGDDDSARELFAMSVPHVADQGALVMALDALTVMGEQELLQQCWDRLQELFPGTGALAKNREYCLLLLCDSSIRGEAPSRAGFEQFETYLADRLYQQSEVDHNALLEHVSETWPDKERLAALGVALHALGHRNFQIAMMAALFAADDERYSEDACWLLLDVLRRMFLDEVQPAEGMEVYKLPLMAICQHLAHHPDAGRMRAELIEILDVELAGTSGLVVAASFAFDVIAAGAPMPRRTAPTASSNEVVLERFLETALQWMSDQVAIELGVTMLPRELVIDEPQRLISALELLMHAGTRMDGVAEDVDALERFAFLIGLLAPLVLGSTADLSALRQVAVKCWLHNRAQHARDLAEQLLSVAGDDPTRRRIAWGSYADILHHTGSTVDALVGLACAAMTNAPMTAANLYQEAYVLLRLARDLGMADMARSVLKTCRRLYAIEGVGEQGRQRLDGIELSLDVAPASALGPEALLALLERTRVHCAEVLE